jgi:hypothetical protein
MVRHLVPRQTKESSGRVRFSGDLFIGFSPGQISKCDESLAFSELQLTAKNTKLLPIKVEHESYNQI